MKYVPVGVATASRALLVVETKVVHRRLQTSHFATDDKKGHHENGSAAGRRPTSCGPCAEVRVGLFRSFLYTKNPATGQLRGVGIEIARALAARLGERSDPAVIVEYLKAGACDVALLGITAGRAAELDFSPPYLQADLTYLVPAGSSVRRVADADQPGVRIAVVRNHAMDFALRGKLKQAEPMYAETPDAAFDLLRMGQDRAGGDPPGAPNVFHPAARFAGAGGPLRGQCHRDGSAEGPGRMAQPRQRVHRRVQNLGLGAAGY